ncbi:hypothetical protein D3C87_175140 [compost metagenome]
MNVAKRLIVIMSSLFLTASCGEPNVLTEFSQRDSDEALFQEAQKRLDEMKWTEALDIIDNQLSASYQAKTEVKDMRASVYAGKCGLTLFTFVANMGTSDSSTVFNFFMSGMRNKIVSPADCDTARDIIIATHGDFAQRPAQQNLNMAILGMAKAGAYLRSKLDQDGSGLGNGALDPAKDVCAPADFTDADVRETVLGFGLLVENLVAVSADLAGATVTQINDFKTQCGIALGFPGPAVPCTLTDATLIDNNINMFRSILNDPSIGVGSCALGDTPFTACPCDGI